MMTPGMCTAARLRYCVFAMSLFASVCAGQDLRDREQAQEKARVMAKQLVTGVLDIQLRQLEENGLEKREIYRDIRAMRNNLDELVDEEMQDIVDLLVKAQAAPQDERLAMFQQTRPAIREVVVRLLAERQRLQRRLKTARLAAEVRRLLEQQSDVYQDTSAAADLPESARIQKSLGIAEDQRDVAAMYFQMVGLLQEMRSWEGPVGAAAGRGLNLLQTADVEPDLKTAAASLQQANFQPATQGQRRVIRTLQTLLEQIDAARGMVSTDRAELVQKVESLIQRQEELRQETLAADLEDAPQRDLLEDSQRALHRDLGALSDAVQAATQTDPALLEQAKQAALDTVDSLFEAKPDEATRAQAQVIGNLAQLKEELIQSLGADRSERSSDELRDELQKLDSAARKLAAAETQEHSAMRSVDDSPAKAASQEASAADQLQQGADILSPGTVQARLEEAAVAADEAESALHDEQLDASERRQAVEEAYEALKAAKGELEVRRADLQRHQLAVEVGELARAAETLERAAAAQEQAADKLQKQDAQLDPAQLHEMAEQQQKVREIAANISEGVKRSAPNARDELARAQSEAKRAEIPLRQMTEGNQSERNQQTAEQGLRKSAEQLQQAAAELRKQQGESAERLANVAGKQLSEVSPIRAETEQALENAQQSASPSEALQRALDQVRKAALKQLEAEGKTDLANAKRQQQQLEDLAAAQKSASQAGKDYAEGRSNSPLEAAARQQQVAENARRLAEETEQAGADGQDADTNKAVAAQLRRTARQAEEAARAALLDSPAQAAQAQQAVADSIAKAAADAQQRSKAAEQAPAGKPDLSAQQEVTKNANQAADQAAQAPGGDAAKQALNRAGEAAAAARDMLAKNGNDKPSQALADQQAAVGQKLHDAEEELQKAIAAAEQQQRTQQAALAQQTEQLAHKAAKLAPAASQALEEAKQAAQRAAAAPPTADAEASDGAPAGPDQPSKSRALERAVASLAAREQEIQRDFNIASALADLAREQQAARDTIKQQAQELDSLTQQSKQAQEAGAPDPHQTQRQVAADSLQQATRQFAQAQQATGQGAVEISGQEEVVNQPIRKGLEQASELPVMDPLEAAGDRSAVAGEAEATSAAQTSANQQAAGDQPAGDAAGQQAAEAGAGEAQTDGNAAQGEAAAGESQSGEGQPGQGQNAQGPPSAAGEQGDAQSSSLGTGMVPNSAQVTANQIAGNQALQQAMEALESGQQGQASEGGATEGSSATPGAETSNNETSAEKDDTQPGVDSAVGTEQSTETDEADRTVEQRRVEGEPWFEKLPPALQQAIRARARTAPPRGYEERLKRYFQRGQ